jgi:hypothetical protein
VAAWDIQMNRLFSLAILSVLSACSADEPTPTDQAAKARPARIVLTEKWVDCAIDNARVLATTKMPAPDAAQAAYKKCAAEKEEWIVSLIEGNATRADAVFVADGVERCMIQVMEKQIDRDRSGVGVSDFKDFKEWASIYDVSSCK